MIVNNNGQNGNDNEGWQNARIADLDNEPANQWMHQQFGHVLDGNWDGNLDNVPVGRMPGEDWGHHDDLPEFNQQEFFGPQNLDVDYTIPAGDDEDCDPRLEHVPALSRAHGDQLCEITLDGMHIIFHKKNDGNRTEETIEFPEGFHGRKCRFFDAAGTLCVMAFEADGVNTLIYDFLNGQVLGGGALPEAIDWDRDTLQKVSLIEGEGLQVVVTSDADGIRYIEIGI